MNIYSPGLINDGEADVMVKVISAHFKENPLKTLYQKFLYFDFFTRAAIIFFILVAIVTPAIIKNYQSLKSRAETTVVTDTDWSNNNFGSQAGIDTSNNSGQLFLQSYLASIIFATSSGTITATDSGNLLPPDATTSGYLISKPINILIGNATISWDAAVPEGTSLKFQVRSASTSGELSLKTFLGPDGTNITYYEVSGTALNSIHTGDSWLQYEVFMTTTDPKITPYLNSVTFTSTPIPTPTPTPVPTSTPTPAPVESVLLTGDSTTVGTLSLVPAFENIAVYSSFSGDNNGNNQATLEYRQAGGSWKPGITMTADRRDTLVLYNSGSIANPYKNQWRAIILGLNPNISYEVKVTYADADGGSNSVQSTVTTLNDNPASVGRTFYVATNGGIETACTDGYTFNKIQKAANCTQAGDTVKIKPGIYNEQVLLTKSGTNNNYITFQSDDAANKAIVTAAVRGTFQAVGSSYIRLKNLDIRSSSTDGSDVYIGSNSNGNIIEDSVLSSVGANWWAGGVILSGEGYSSGPTNTLIQRNQISTTATGVDGPFGVLLNETSGGTVVRNNTITGGFYDGIGGGPNFGVKGGPYQNSYLYNNVISGAQDDGIEAEGGGINSAVWGNTISNGATMGMATAPVIVGPMYVFRNTITMNGVGQAGVKLGSSSYGFLYYYHNTFYHANNSGFGLYGSDSIIDNVVFRNNIMEVQGGNQYVIEEGSGGLGKMDFDYNSMYSSRTENIKWLNNWFSWANWRTKYNKELHGIFGQENFVNVAGGDLRLQGAAIGVDKGVILPGFNDANSPWPYSGSAPDIGALEYGSGAPKSTPTPSIPVSTNTPTPILITQAVIPTSTLTPTKIPTPAPTKAPTSTPTLTLTPTLTPSPTPAPCSFVQAFWSTSTATEGQKVTLNATGNNSCNGKQINFEVRENDSLLEGLGDEPVLVNPLSSTFASGSATTIWTAEWQEDGLLGIFNPPEYFFKATLAENPSTTIRSADPLLTVDKFSGPLTTDSTTVGALSLVPTYESISVYANFTNDLNGNNQATLNYRPTGGTWIRGMDMTPDRRTTIGGIANPYKNQWRASVLGLQPNTTYEIKVTFLDSNGISGANSATGTITTRNDNPPSAGKSYFVATTGNDSNPGTEVQPFKTIQHGVNVLSAGDTLYVKAGTYAEGAKITISNSGTADNYITVRNYGSDTVTVDSTGNLGLPGWGSIAPAFHIRGNYIRLKGFTTIGSNTGIYVGPNNSPAEVNPHDVIVEDNITKDSKTLTSTPSSYYGIMIGGRSENWITSMQNITVQNNNIYVVEPGATIAGIGSGPGIYMLNANGGHVIRNNNIFYSGTLNVHGMDGINNSPNFTFDYTMRDTDIYGNYIQGCTDDGISLDGNAANVRVWNNTITRCNMAISIAPIMIGPTYIFRNIIYDPERHWVPTNGFTKGGQDGTGHVFIYHNTVLFDDRYVGTTFPNGSGKDASQNAGMWNSAGGGNNSENVFSRNNIFELDGAPVIDNTGRPNMDYDLIYNYRTYTSTYWAKWGGNSYNDMSSFQSGAGQEAHGVAGQATFVNKNGYDFRLNSGSLGLDQGALIYGFNDQNSPWPYSGSAPDIGAYEYGSSIPSVTAPVATNTPTQISNNSTITGVLGLNSTYESISVYAPFTGDENANNSASFMWRESGGTWKQGMAMTGDRRDNVTSGDYTGGPGTFPNTYKNQWRASILGLSPNTDYEIRITFADNDGVSGSPIVGTIKTRNNNIPLGTGRTFYVSPSGPDSDCVSGNTFPTIQQAATCLQAGDTIYIKAGTYREEVSLTKSGTANNWITIMNYGSDIVTIDGENTRLRNMIITSAQYIRIKGLRFINSYGNPGSSGGNGGALDIIASDYGQVAKNIVIESNYFTGFGGSAIFINGGYGTMENIVIQSNEFVRTTGKITGTEGHIISIWNTDGGHIIRNNIIKDESNNFPRQNNYYWDCIGGGNNFGQNSIEKGGFVNKDSDIYGNYIEGCNDDGIEAEGPMANVRIWNNTLKNNFIGIASAAIATGPLYVFRNRIEIDAPDRLSAYKWGQYSAGFGYFYHNTIYMSSGGNGYDQTNPGISNYISRNNIIRAGTYVMQFSGDCVGCSFNYDDIYTTDPGRFVKWGGTTSGYSSFSTFKTTTGQELQGLSVDTTNEFIDSANDNFNLRSTSQFIDKGQVLIGFNDKDSSWPSNGLPDIGAYEYGSSIPSVTVPVATNTPTPTPTLTPCSFAQAFWSTANTTEGQQVTLNLTGNSACIGKTVNFEVRENDSVLEGLGDDPVLVNPVSATFATGSATTTWTAEWQEDCLGLCNPPEYFFNASLVTDQNVTIRSADPLLTVDKVSGPGDATTIGSLSLLSGLANISVISSFTNDNNANNFAVLEYKPQSSSTWEKGVTMTVDRRATYIWNSGSGQQTSANPYVNQWRAVIFGLTENTAYDVRVTYTDANGGSGTVTGTISTRNSNPSMTTNHTYYVAKTGNDSTGDGSSGNPWLTVSQAAKMVVPGDTVRIRAGTYNEQLIILTSGTATNYITWTSDDISNKAIITSAPASKGTIRISNKSYNRFKDLNIYNTATGATGADIYITGASSIDNIIDGSLLSSVANDYYAGGVWVETGPVGTIIKGNTITTSATGTNGPFGVGLNGTGGSNDISYNTVTGGFYDGLGGGGANSSITGSGYINSYIYKNTVSGAQDDGIEFEGGDINSAVYNNVINNGGGYSSIAVAPTLIGPMYIVGNVGYNEGQLSVKLGSSSGGFLFFYHNTFYHKSGGGNNFGGWGNDGVYNNFTSKNNVMYIYAGDEHNYQTAGSNIATWASDYNSFYSSNSGTAFRVNGVDYSFTNWKSNFNQDANSSWGQPNFVNADGGNVALVSGDARIDTGTVIVGINDIGSLWAYSGSAPDIGAYEYGSSIPSVTVPVATNTPTPILITQAVIPTSTLTPTSVPPTLIPNPTSCSFVSASWNSTSATEGQQVTLNLTGNSVCNGKTVNFEVRENDSVLEGLGDDPVSVNPVSATFATGSATTTWTAEWQEDCLGLCNPPEYFFNASLVTDPNVTIRSADPLLTVDKFSGPLTGDATTVGELTLIPTYESIGVYANFSGDDNANNFASLEWRQSGGQWKKGMDLVVDRRDTVGAGLTNTYKNQWRASVLGLQPNTTYEVKVAFLDSNGISGANSATGTITTRTENIGSVGTAYYVDTNTPGASDSNSGTEAAPFKTIAKAAGIVNPGDTVYIKAGTYSPFSIARGGTATNYATFRNFGTDKVIINAVGSGSGITIAQSYIRVKGFEIIGGTSYGIQVYYYSTTVQPHDIIIEDNILRDGKTLTSTPASYSGIYIAGREISVTEMMERITIQRNEIYMVNPTGGNIPTGPGIWLYRANGGHVIRDNRIITTGTIPMGVHGQDCIVNSPNFQITYTWRDTDIYNNYCQGATDDGISIDGNAANLRVWGNTIVRTNSGISAAPVLVGPAYIFRNVLYDPEVHWASVHWVKGGENGTGMTYFYNNTLVYDDRFIGTTKTDGSGKESPGNYGFALAEGSGADSTNIYALNNIIETDGRIAADSNQWPVTDYNLIYNHFTYTARSDWTQWGNTSFGNRTQTNAKNFADFQSGTCGIKNCQEAHGVAGQATFVDRANKNFQLAEGSLGIDQGVIIPGFNDADSPWPYSGLAPDIGAYEYGSSIPSVTVPVATNTPTPTPTLTPCSFAQAFWSTSTATEGQQTTLNVTGNSACIGKQINFEVRENDSLLEGLGDEPVLVNPASVTFASSSATTTWIAQWQEDGLLGIFNPPEYFFKATLTDDQNVTIRSADPLLEVNKPSVPLTENSTTVGALSLIPTFESIGVYANFTGDLNGNNKAVLFYQQGGNWIQGMDMTPDRRDTVSTEYSNQVNPYKNQWRASLLGLSPNTTYEVQVIFSDADGVGGAKSIIGTIATRNDNPPSIGKTYYVATTGNDATGKGLIENPWRTLKKGVMMLAAGDTLLVRGGTYSTESPGIIVAANGTSDNWITIKNYPGEKVIVDATNHPGSLVFNTRAVGWHIKGDYIRITGIETIGPNVGVSSNIGMWLGPELGGSQEPHDVIVEYGTFRDAKTLLSTPQKYVPIHIGGYDYATHTNMNNITIQNNSMYIVEPGATNEANASGAGIYMYNANGGHVIRNNDIYFTGTLNIHGSDGINNGPNFELEYTLRDTDIYGNYIQGATDDGISLDGNSANVRVWNNTITRANMGISAAPVIIGPAYIFRNVWYDPEPHWISDGGTNYALGWLKLGELSTGHVYVYHNTIVYGNLNVGTKISKANYGYANWGDPSSFNNISLKNNIIETDGPIGSSYFSTYGPGPTMDYDLLYNYWSTPYKSYWARWNGVNVGTRSNTNTQNFVAFKSQVGQEAHGVAGQATFLDKANKDFRLAVGSLGIDQGIAIPGFNDANSPWPSNGLPDIGAYEYGTAAPITTLTLTPTPIPLTPAPTKAPTSTPTNIPTSAPTSMPISTLTPAPPTPTPAPTACVINSGSWTGTSTVEEGSKVTLAITTNKSKSCLGKKIVVHVKKDNGLLPADSVTVDPEPIDASIATTEWIAEYRPGFLGLFGTPEYFFEAGIGGEEKVIRSSDPKLRVNEAIGLVISTTPQVLASTNSATIKWSTNSLSSSGIIYGVTAQTIKIVPAIDVNTKVTSHEVTISNLKPCTVYHYKTMSEDSSLQKAISPGFKFVTSGCNANVINTIEMNSPVTSAIGGSLNLLDTFLKGVDLGLPPDFSTTDASFQILKLDGQEFVNKISSPAGLNSIGNNVYHFNAFAVSEDTQISTFSKSLTVKIKYTPDDIANVDEDSLTIYRWDGETWHALTNCTIDKTVRQISCETGSFSDFVLFGKPLSSPTPAPTQAPSQNIGGGGSSGGGGGGGGGGGSSGGGGGSSGGSTGGSSGSGSSSSADLNRDGRVNIFDLSVLLRNWNKSGAGDLNGDGRVNIFDLSVLLRSWK